MTYIDKCQTARLNQSITRRGSKVKVLHIVGDSKFGGGSAVILTLARVAKSLGWTVDVLTTDAVFHEVLAREQIGILDLDVIWRDTRPMRDCIGLWRLYAFLRSHDYDIIHTHTSKGGFVGRLAARAARIPTVVHTVHGFAFHEESSRSALLLYSSLERLAALFCEKIITVSEFHRTRALGLGIAKPEKIVAVPNGILENRIKPRSHKKELRRSWGVSDKELVLLSTGRLSEQKGLEFLIRCVPFIRERPDLRFKVVIAGEGPLRERLERISEEVGVSGQVLFIGFQPDVGGLLAASDVVVLPSLWEGLSIALLEAMAAAKPIVTTLIGSNIEVTRNGQAAVLVPPKDPAALAEAVISLAVNPSLRASITAAARQIFLSQYTEARMASEYKRIYLELARPTEKSANI